MIKLSSVAARLDQAGPFLLGALACTGVFAKGWASIAFGLLALWGIYTLARRPGSPPLPPGRWWAGLVIFGLTWLAAILASGQYLLGLKYLGYWIYPIALIVSLAWLAFSQRPDSVPWPRLMWGLGLMVVAVLTFREGGYRLICMRAKAHLGILELGSILGLLIPVMVAAFLHYLSIGCRNKTVFFALAIVAASVALNQNCARQTMLAAPVISLLLLWAYRHSFHGKPRRQMLILALVMVVVLPLTFGSVGRLISTLEVKADPESTSWVLNKSDELRLTIQSLGWSVFQDNKLLGQGPGTVHLTHDAFPGKVLHSHNLFIHLLAESGIVGLAGFMALHLAPLSLIWPHRHSRDPETFFWVWAALAVSLQMFLNGMTDMVFGNKRVAFIYWTVITAALWQTQRPPRPAQKFSQTIENEGQTK